MDEAKLNLEEMANGYQYAAMLLSACRTGLFEAMGDRVRTAVELAADRGLDPRAVERVLLALAGTGVVSVEDGGFRLRPDPVATLLPGGPGTQAVMFNHQHGMLTRWARLADVLRTGRPVEREPDPDHERDYILGMENVSRRAVGEVAAMLDLSGRRRLLDVGGGPATASLAFARRFPDLECTVFDRPGPAAIAREQIAAAGMGDRVDVVEGDILVAGPAGEYDAAYVSNLIHEYAPEQTATLFARVRDALAPGGVMAVKDFFLEPCRTRPTRAARFSVNMLVCTSAGRCYTWDETEALLADAGFGDFRRETVARVSGLIVGRRL